MPRRSLSPLARLMKLLLVPFSVLVAAFALLLPARADVTERSGELASESSRPAVLLLAPERADEIRQRLGSQQRIYTVSKWSRPHPQRLARLLAAVDEPEIILVGQTPEHLRTDAIPETGPRIVGRIVVERPADEIAWSVARLVQLSGARTVDSTARRALYRVLPPRS